MGRHAPLTGFVDLLPDEAGRLRALEETAREVFGEAGYREVRPPLVESSALFERTSGATSDIVQKQMFAIPSRDGDETFVLRPEGTPGVFRAYLEAGFAKTNPFQKLFYLGPMFRYERPQKGRQRQFHQFGVEAIGASDPLLDAETILLAWRFYRRLGMKDVRLLWNAIGCPGCRPAYLEALRAALAPSRAGLCPLCSERFDRNVLRLFDCKNEGCKALAARAPRIDGSLCEPCREHDRRVTAALAAAAPSPPAARDDLLVRGLDYYTRTVFEFHHPGLGARSAVCAGGRYDGLGEALGGGPIPAVGFAIGAEATRIAAEAEGLVLGAHKEGIARITLAYVSAGERDAAFRLTERLRETGVGADIDHMGRSLKSQMKGAASRGAREVWILGPEEAATGSVKVHGMSDGAEAVVPVEEALARAASRAGAPA